MSPPQIRRSKRQLSARSSGPRSSSIPSSCNQAPMDGIPRSRPQYDSRNMSTVGEESTVRSQVLFPKDYILKNIFLKDGPPLGSEFDLPKSECGRVRDTTCRHPSQNQRAAKSDQGKNTNEESGSQRPMKRPLTPDVATTTKRLRVHQTQGGLVQVDEEHLPPPVDIPEHLRVSNASSTLSPPPPPSTGSSKTGDTSASEKKQRFKKAGKKAPKVLAKKTHLSVDSVAGSESGPAVGAEFNLGASELPDTTLPLTDTARSSLPSEQLAATPTGPTAPESGLTQVSLTPAEQTVPSPLSTPIKLRWMDETGQQQIYSSEGDEIDQAALAESLERTARLAKSLLEKSKLKAEAFRRMVSCSAETDKLKAELEQTRKELEASRANAEQSASEAVRLAVAATESQKIAEEAKQLLDVKCKETEGSPTIPTYRPQSWVRALQLTRDSEAEKLLEEVRPASAPLVKMLGIPICEDSEDEAPA